MTSLQHKRALWIGLLACALTPTVFLVSTLLMSSDRYVVPVVAVLIVSLPLSLLATYCVAFPYILWLRRRRWLSALNLCIAGALVGALVFASFNFYMNWFPQMNDRSFAFDIAMTSARKGLFSGALIGALSSVALSAGAGIRFRPIGRATPGKPVSDA